MKIEYESIADFEKNPYLKELSMVKEDAMDWVLIEMEKANKKDSQNGVIGLCQTAVFLHRFLENILRGLMTDVDILTTIEYIESTGYIPEYIFIRNELAR